MKYLITGVSGFVAGHLIEAILKKDSQAEIIGIDLSEPIDDAICRLIRFIKVDLSIISGLIKCLEMMQPQFVIHLASSSSVAHSWRHPIETFKNNSVIFLNLLEAVKQVNSDIRILAVGSSEQYGVVSVERIPLKETEPSNPVSPYAVARVAQENMALVYARGFKLDIVATRSFNHFGPRQDSKFVLSSFAKQIAEIKKEKRDPVISVGDLNVIRDFSDVRDVVNAYFSLLDKGIAGEIYNVCSGRGKTIGDCLTQLIGIADIKCEIQKCEDLVRPVDNPVIVGDNAKIKKQTGWSPEISFENSLCDMYEYWLSKI